MSGAQFPRVLASLGAAIVGGALAPGATMSLEAIEREHGVSRSVAREVVRVLQTRGLVEVVKRIGVRVLPMERWHLLDPMVIAWRIESPGGAVQLRSLLELRTAIEPVAAALAAEHATPDDGRALIDIALRMREAGSVGDVETFLAHDVAFHARMLHASGNELFAQLDAVVASVLSAHTHHPSTPVGPTDLDLDRHLDVADAIHARDVERARATMALIATKTMGEALAIADAEPRLVLPIVPR